MKKLLVCLMLVLALAACAGEPETVTVKETVVSEVEVTRLVEVTQEVEVTRLVEVMQEVEVTREVEVTQVVEIVVTATPEPTEEPTATPEPTNTPVPATVSAAAPPTATPQADISTTLLNSMTTARSNMENFGFLIDQALRSGIINCQTVVDTYNSVANAPTYDVANSSQTVQYAYGVYRSAVQIFADGSRGIYQNCADFLANPSGGGIPFQQWGGARQSVNTAVDTINPGIQSLGGG